MKSIIFPALFFFVTILFAIPANATSTGMNVRILPMDCVFNVVNVGGKQQIVYVTPEECGQVVTPIDPGASGGSSSNQNSGLNLTQQPTLRVPSLQNNSNNQAPWYFPAESSPGASVTPGLSTRPSGDGIILLNLFPEYLRNKNDTGKDLSLSAGQAVYFDYKDIRYIITIVEVTSDSVSLLFTQVLSMNGKDSNVLGDKALHDTLSKGMSGEYSLTGEDGAHIRITYLGTNNGVATLKFKELGRSSASDNCSPENPCWLWLFIIMVVVNMVVIYLLIKKRQKNNDVDSEPSFHKQT